MSAVKIPRIKNLEDLRRDVIDDMESLVYDYGCDLGEDFFDFAEHTQDVRRLDRVHRNVKKLFPKRIPATKDD